MSKTTTLIAALSLVMSTGASASAQSQYPERPIDMIVAYSAGGGTDIAARTMVPFLEKYLGGATINVVNRPGAGGEIGFTAVALAQPDGYTIGFINTPNLLTIPISRDTRYDIEDIELVSNVIYDPGAFSLRPDEGIATLEDLVDFAKANPGEVTYGTTGIGSDDHLAALAFERQAGVEFEHIPFSGNADVRAAVLGGHVMMASMNISETVPDADEGTLVLLGQMSEERWEGAPNVPTFKEQGFDVIMGSDRGIGAPAGLPEDISLMLQEAVRQTVEDSEFRAAAEQQDLALSYQDAEAFDAHITALRKNLIKLWEEQPWIKEE